MISIGGEVEMAINYEAFLIARQRIIDSVSIPEYYMDYVDETVNLDVYGKDRCPLHDEETPSFFYFRESGLFHCFGCGKTGAVTELHYHIQKRVDPSYTKIKAVLDLAKMYNIPIPNIFKSSVSLDEIKTLKKHEKLPFLTPDQLKKPSKKIEKEILEEIENLREVLSRKDVKDLYDEVDEIFFKGANVEKEVEELRKKMQRMVL